MLRALCREWNYTPEQALQAPVWLLRTTAILNEIDRHEAEKHGR